MIDLLETVTIEGLATYLRARGWAGTPDGQWTFEFEEGLGEVEIPVSPADRRFRRTVSEALHNLVLFEKRPLHQILTEVVYQDRDRLRLRLAGGNVGVAGRLGIDGAPLLTKGLRDLVLAGACAAIDTRPAYHTRKPAEAIAVLNDMSIAPFEGGSFTVVIEAKMPPRLQEQMEDIPEETAQEPMARRTGLRLAEALVALVGGLAGVRSQGRADALYAGVPAGVSANLCDAVADVLKGGGAERLEASWSWASIRPTSYSTPPVALNASDMPLLREAAAVLRAREPVDGFELEGVVVKLASADPSEGGVIIVQGNLEGRGQRMSLDLDPQAYALACEAHQKGDTVYAVGSLRKDGRLFKLHQPTGFRSKPG